MFHLNSHLEMRNYIVVSMADEILVDSIVQVWNPYITGKKHLSI